MGMLWGSRNGSNPVALGGLLIALHDTTPVTGSMVMPGCSSIASLSSSRSASDLDIPASGLWPFSLYLPLPLALLPLALDCAFGARVALALRLFSGRMPPVPSGSSESTSPASCGSYDSFASLSASSVHSPSCWFALPSATNAMEGKSSSSDSSSESQLSPTCAIRGPSLRLAI